MLIPIVRTFDPSIGLNSSVTVLHAGLAQRIEHGGSVTLSGCERNQEKLQRRDLETNLFLP